MSFTLNNDKKPGALQAKGQWLFPITQLAEYNRVGMAKYPAVKAQGALTATGNAANGDVVVIGTKSYSLVTTLSGVDGQVKIGSTKEETLANLAAAINLNGVPNSQYATQTSLNKDVTATVSGAVLTATAKVGGVAGNSIVTTDTSANMTWNAGTLGTTRAGVDQSDADSVLVPNYYAAVSSSSAQQYGIREQFYIGAGEEDGGGDRIWNHQRNAMNFYMHDYKLKAGATRKLFMPNHWDRNTKRIDIMNVKSYMKRPEWQQLASPFAESTSNIAFHTVEMGDDRFALFYRQQAGTTGIYVVIGQMQNDGSVTWGTPTLVTAKDQYDANFDAILINTDKILCTFGEGASDFMQTATLTVSGTVVSKNTSVQVVATAYAWKRLTKLNTDKALLAVYTGTTLSIYVVTVTGTVPSYGTVVNQSTSQYPIITQNGTDKVQLVFGDTAASRLKSAVITVTGTTPTIQASTIIGYDINAAYKVTSHNLIQVATDKFIYYHGWGSLVRGRDRARLVMFTVSGNTTTVASYLDMVNPVYDTNVTYIKSLGSNSYGIYNQGAKRTGKITVDTTNNLMSFTDIPTQSNVQEESARQPIGMYKYAETNNLQRMADPAITTKGWAFCHTDNNLSGAIVMWSDKQFSFEVYVNDNLYGTYTKTLVGAHEGIPVNITLNTLEAALKIKNTGTVDLFFMLPNIMASID